VLDGISAPVNVQLRRLSSKVLEVTWQAPDAHYHHVIAGYRVYYHISVSSSSMAHPHGADLTDTRWEVRDVDGPLTVTKLTGLKPHTQYAVRVRARGVDGRLGNFSEAAVLEESDRTAGWIVCNVVNFRFICFDF